MKKIIKDIKAPSNGVALLASVLTAFSLSAEANCTPVNGWMEKQFNIYVPVISVSRSTPVGSVIFSQRVYFSAGQQFIDNCYESIYSTFRNGLNPNSQGIAPTNISGVGLRITDHNQLDTRYYGANGSQTISFNVGGGGIWGTIQGFTVELVKTGPITAGALASGRYAGLQVANAYWITAVNISNAGGISSTGCTVKTTSVTVPLGTVNRSNLFGVGSVSSEKRYSLSLDCEQNQSVEITFNGTPDTSQAPGVIALDAAGQTTVATGIGIQLLVSGRPVTIGSPALIGTISGLSTIDLSARYYKTKNSVTPGQANGTATFIMKYN